MTNQDDRGLPSPAAVRLQRPGWRDPRLLLGVMLVAGSVALSSWLVSSAAQTSPVYATEGALVVGETVDPTRLVVRQVRLGEVIGTYLPAGESLPDDLVVVRTVGAGELVPRSAVAEHADVAVRPLAVTPGGVLPAGVVEGSTVDLWFLADAADAADAAPRQLAAGLTVAEVSQPSSAFAVGSAVTVQVLVPVDDLPVVLAALSADGSVEVVHVPGAGPQP